MITPDESIRRATQAEALPVADLLLRSRHATAGIPPGPFSDDEVRTWFREVAMASSREVWVMAGGGTLTAMMVLNGHWIEQLFVAPEHLRDGRGSQLLKHAQSSRSELELWVFEANAPAIAFYEKHGFQAFGPASSENQEQAQAICYRWTRPTANS